MTPRQASSRKTLPTARMTKLARRSGATNSSGSAMTPTVQASPINARTRVNETRYCSPVSSDAA